MTEFHVEVVRLDNVQKHPNADTLSIATLHDAYPVIFKTGEFQPGDLAAYVPVDSIVPDTEEWSWLAPAGAALRPKDRRIRAKKLRGIFSMGVLMPAPAGAELGADIADAMGITKYDPDAANEAVAEHVLKPWRTLCANVPWWKAMFWWVVIYLGLASFFGRDGWTRPTKPPSLKYLPGVYDIEPFRKYGKHWFQHG